MHPIPTAAFVALSAIGATILADPLQSVSAQAPAESDAPIAAAEARETAAAFARLVEENYVFPDIGRKYAQTLRARASRGDYDKVGTRGALAAALTKHVQAVHRDRHLRMLVQSAAAGAQSQMMMVGPQAQQGPVEASKPGPGKPIEEARWLAPGIAYIRFTIFPLDPAVTAAAADFMKDHADADTVIFDVRTNKGGGMSQAMVMLPYLFDKETVLVRGDVRSSVIEGMIAPPAMPPWMRLASPAREGVRTEDTLVRPHPSERRLFDAKVYVLTSNFTASAAEAFAFGLRTTDRATLVGERTTGVGHFAPPGQRVNDKFGAFVPIGRAYDPRTGEGWEGTGVQPHIEVPAEKALVEALVRSGIAAGEAERLSASVHPPGSMTRANLTP